MSDGVRVRTFVVAVRACVRAYARVCVRVSVWVNSTHEIRLVVLGF